MCITPVAEKIQTIYEGNIESLSEHLAEIRGLATATGADDPSPTSDFPTSRAESIAKRMSGFSVPSGTSSPDFRNDPQRRPAAPPTPIRTPEMLAMDSSKALRYSSEFQDAAAKLHPILLPLGVGSLQPKVDHSPHSHPHISSLPPAPLRRAVTTSHLNSGPVGRGIEEKSLPRRPASDATSIQLPPPAWDEETASLNKTQPLSLIPTIQPEAIKLSRSTSTISQKDAFERHLFQNSAILCDL
jgi:hypothetical protein